MMPDANHLDFGLEAAIDLAVSEQKQARLILQDSQEANDSRDHQEEAKVVCTLVQLFVKKHMLRYCTVVSLAL
jgi:hypothetical protein